MPASFNPVATRSTASPLSPDRRTCARSPNSCTSSTPGSRLSASIGGRAPSADDFEHDPGKRGLQRRRLVERHHGAFVQQRDAAAALGLVEVRGGHDDGQPRREELRQQLPELAARYRVHARRRLVEEQEPGPVDQRAGERELLLHAARQAVGATAAERRQLGHVEETVALLARSRERRESPPGRRCSRRW